MAPERIVYDHRGGRAGDPVEQFRATWNFEALGAKTRITMRMVFSTAAVRQRLAEQYGAIEGGEQTLQRLAQQLASLSAQGTSGHDFVITRVLAAARELVFQAFTRWTSGPGQLPLWHARAVGTLLTLRWAPLPSATAQERQTFDAAHPSMQQG